MATTINITEIYRKAFGTEPPKMPVVEKALAKQTTSSLGANYYGVDVNGIEHFMPVVLDGYLLPFATVDITTRKIIVSTPMTELEGAVHEIVGEEDYLINVRGLLLQETYPEREVVDWHNIYKQNKSISISCVRTAPFVKGNDKVIIKEVKWPPSNSEHVQAIEMQLITDRIFTLEA